MNPNDIKQYVGKQVLIELNNGLKFTATIPDFEGNSFTIIDKFDKQVTIDCELVMMVYEK